MPRRWTLAFLVSCLQSATLPAQEPFAAADLADSVEPPNLNKSDSVLQPPYEPPGMKWRLETSNGIVYVWSPMNLRQATAGVVVYVHGYYTDVDGAWSEHCLAEQFWLSRQNAVFVVPEAPRDDNDIVFWEDLEVLLKTVFGKIRRPRPKGPLVVVGHSGAFRTILPWLVHKRVRQIILLDGLYGGEDEFAAWLRTGKGRRRLVLISVETLERAKRLTGRFSASVDLARVPDSLAELSRRDRRAALIHIQGTWDHMELVTAGQVLPALLRLTPLKRTGQAPDD